MTKAEKVNPLCIGAYPKPGEDAELAFSNAACIQVIQRKRTPFLRQGSPTPHPPNWYLRPSNSLFKDNLLNLGIPYTIPSCQFRKLLLIQMSYSLLNGHSVVRPQN